MVKWTKKLKCIRCGRIFKAEFGDAISEKDVETMKRPICHKCQRVISILSILKKQDVRKYWLLNLL